LTYFVPLFATSGLVLTSLTIAGQAVVWWLIVLFRPVKGREKSDSGRTTAGSSR
jgi:hypothetical protein